MKRYGDVRIRKRFDEKQLADDVRVVLEEVFDEKTHDRGYIDKEGYIVKDMRGSPIIVYLGRKASLTLAKDMKGKVSCIAIRVNHDMIDESKLKQAIGKIEKLTGGKFYG